MFHRPIAAHCTVAAFVLFLCCSIIVDRGDARLLVGLLYIQNTTLYDNHRRAQTAAVLVLDGQPPTWRHAHSSTVPFRNASHYIRGVGVLPILCWWGRKTLLTHSLAISCVGHIMRTSARSTVYAMRHVMPYRDGAARQAGRLYANWRRKPVNVLCWPVAAASRPNVQASRPIRQLSAV